MGDRLAGQAACEGRKSRPRSRMGASRSWRRVRISTARRRMTRSSVSWQVSMAAGTSSPNSACTRRRPRRRTRLRRRSSRPAGSSGWPRPASCRSTCLSPPMRPCAWPPLPVSEIGERWNEARQLLGLLALFSVLAAAASFATVVWSLRPLRTLAGALAQVEHGGRASLSPVRDRRRSLRSPRLQPHAAGVACRFAREPAPFRPARPPCRGGARRAGARPARRDRPTALWHHCARGSCPHAAGRRQPVGRRRLPAIP